MGKSAVRGEGNTSLRFEDYEKMCHWLTKRLMRGQGHTGMSYEDVFQEVCLQWCKCRDTFKPELGFSFSTYFVRSTLPQQANMRKRLLGKGHDTTDSLHMAVNSSDDDARSLMDVVQDFSAENPESQVIRHEAIAIECERNPLLRRLVELSVNPTPELRDQVRALESQRSWARQLGVRMQEKPPSQITPTMLRSIFRLNWRQRSMTQPICGLIQEMT